MKIFNPGGIKHRFAIAIAFFLIINAHALESQNIKTDTLSIQKARQYFKDITQYKKAQNRIATAKVSILLGDLYQKYNDYAKAIEYFNIGLAGLRVSNQQQRTLATTLYAKIVNAYLSLQKIDAAELALQKGFKLAEKSNSTEPFIELLLQKGLLQITKGDRSGAYRLFKKAREVAQQTNQTRMLLRLYGHLGAVSNNPQSAKRYAFAQNDLARQLKDSTYLLMSNHRIAHLLFLQNELDSALWYNNLTLPTPFYSQQNDTLFKATWKLRSIILEKMGRTEEAITAIDTIVLAEKRDQKQGNPEKLLWEQLSIDQAESEMKANAEASLKRQQNIRNILVAVGLFLSLTGLFFWVQSLQKRKVNQKLSRQNQLLEAQNKEQAQSNQFKNQLLKIVSHDLRSPLFSLKIILANLGDPAQISAQQQKEWLDILSRQSSKTNVLLENILCWVDLQMHNYQPSRQVVLLLPIVNELVETAQLMHQEKELPIQVNIQPALTGYADPEVLRIAIRNLLDNAIKFSEPDQPIDISAWEEEDTMRISVKDQGIGMNEDQLKQALGGKLSTEGTSGEKSWGLGLSLIKQFIEKHGGQIIGQSKPNFGTSFTIILPQSLAEHSI
jgi:signal transduction histidine kinase